MSQAVVVLVGAAVEEDITVVILLSLQAAEDLDKQARTQARTHARAHTHANTAHAHTHALTHTYFQKRPLTFAC